MTALPHSSSFDDEAFAGQTLDPPAALAPPDDHALRALSDEALITAFKAGSDAAFAELYRRHRALVREVCRYRLRDRDLAEEALQETFTRAYRELRRFEPRVPVERWLRRIAKNHCTDVIRRRRREITGADANAKIVVLEDARAASNLERVEHGAVVRSVLGPLSTRDRELLVSHHAEGVDVETLSRRWGMTRGSMAVALHRARARARAHDPGDIWGIAPLLWWWRTRRAGIQRLATASEAFGPSFQVAVAHLAVAAAVAASSVLAPVVARAETAPVAPRVVEGHEGVTVTASPERDRRPPAPARKVSDASPPRPADDRGADGKQPDHDAVTPVEVAPVAVPGTPVQVHQRRPEGKPRTKVGVQVPVEDPESVAHVELHGDDEHAFVAEEACTVAEAASPAGYCER